MARSEQSKRIVIFCRIVVPLRSGHPQAHGPAPAAFGRYWRETFLLRAPSRGMRGSRPLARSHHPFLNKFFVTERTEFRTEVTGPNPGSARCALGPGLRVLGEIGLVTLRGEISGIGSAAHPRLRRAEGPQSQPATPTQTVSDERRAPAPEKRPPPAEVLAQRPVPERVETIPDAGQAEPAAFAKIRAERAFAVESVGRNGRNARSCGPRLGAKPGGIRPR